MALLTAGTVDFTDRLEDILDDNTFTAPTLDGNTFEVGGSVVESPDYYWG
jgi:hypothetical protein